MKRSLFFFLFMCKGLFVWSQTDHNYYVFAYGQLQSGNSCYQKVGFINEYRAYTAEESQGKAEEIKEELKKTYTESKGYTNIYVELVKPGSVMIVFEGTRTAPDGKCTTTYYGAVVAGTLEEAESQFGHRILDWAPAVLSNKKVLKNEVNAPVVKRVNGTGKATADYHGLKAAYRIEQAPAGTGTVIRCDWRNTNPDVTAVITFSDMSGAVMKELKVPAAASATEVIAGENMFRITVRFEPGNKTGPGTIAKLRLTVDERLEGRADGSILLSREKDPE